MAKKSEETPASRHLPFTPSGNGRETSRSRSQGTLAHAPTVLSAVNGLKGLLQRSVSGKNMTPKERNWAFSVISAFAPGYLTSAMQGRFSIVLERSELVLRHYFSESLTKRIKVRGHEFDQLMRPLNGDMARLDQYSIYLEAGAIFVQSLSLEEIDMASSDLRPTEEIAETPPTTQSPTEAKNNRKAGGENRATQDDLALLSRVFTEASRQIDPSLPLDETKPIVLTVASGGSFVSFPVKGQRIMKHVRVEDIDIRELLQSPIDVEVAGRAYHLKRDSGHIIAIGSKTSAGLEALTKTQMGELKRARPDLSRNAEVNRPGAQVVVRFDDNALEITDRAAAILGQTRSEFLRDAAVFLAKKTLGNG